MASKNKRRKREVIGFLGVGLDNADGHQRLTQSEHFILVGGSQETHERMQDTAIKFNEALDRRGKPLQDTTLPEIIELFHETNE